MCALVTGVQTWALPIWHVLAAPLRLETHAEEADADFVRDRLQLLEMAGDLAAGLVDRLDGRARQFDLPGRIERDRSAIALQELGRAPCREGVCQYVYITVDARCYKHKNQTVKEK